MSPSRPTPHRLRRDRREVAVAVASAAAILLLTALLLWILAPGDDSPPPSAPPITVSTPSSGSDATVPDTAETGVPDTTAPAPGAGETSTTTVGG